MKETFGLIAIILGICAAVPYIYGILKKTVRPHRISWAIWSFISLVTLISYISAGAHWSALLAVAAAFNNLVIFLLALKLGTGGSTIQDKAALLVAVIGIVIWVFTRQAAFGLVFALGADFIGLILTLKKTYKEPRSESTLAWGMAATASLFGLLAVHTYNFSQTVYPIYAIASGLSLFLSSIIFRNKRVGN